MCKTPKTHNSTMILRDQHNIITKDKSRINRLQNHRDPPTTRTEATQRNQNIQPQRTEATQPKQIIQTQSTEATQRKKWVKFGKS